ncbi:MAG: hypothetical protein ACR2LN_06875 [Candidatus Levyibacteriota bacterium]
MVNKRLRNYTYLYLTSLGVTILLYWRLFLTFYQQDEWQALGHFSALGWKAIGENLTPLDLLLAKGRLLTVGIYDLIFTYEPYGVITISIITILLHALNGFLIFLLMQKIFKKKIISIFASLFFLTNAVANQAVIWSGASIAIIGSTTCVLLSMSYFLSFLENEKYRDYILSFLFLFISLQFKESALAIIPFFVAFAFFLKWKILPKKFYLISLIPLIYFILFLTLRVGGSLASTQKVGDYVNQSHNVKVVIVANGITYFVTSVAQIFFPADFIYPLATKFLKAEYQSLSVNPQFDLISQTVITDMINTLVSLLFLGLLFMCAICRKQLTLLWFFLGILAVTLLPYIIIQRGSSYLESRYYYLLLVPICGFLGIILTAFIKFKQKLYFIAFSVFLLLLISSYVLLDQKELIKQQNLAETRIAILHTIKQEVPSLQKKTVFYIQSDQSYILPTNPLPFQEGIGYTFLEYLHNTNSKMLDALLINNFLWDIGTQGYKTIDGYGYGLFTDKYTIENALKEKKFTKDAIIVFYWDSKKQKLRNITKSYHINSH